MNITVYLGAFEGKDPKLAEAVRELGKWIGESGNLLVYGGQIPGKSLAGRNRMITGGCKTASNGA